MKLLALAALFAAQPFSVVDHRPLAAILDQMELEFRTPIHYEDPRYATAKDLEDVATDEIKQRAKDPTFKLIVPRKASLIVPRLSDRSAQIEMALTSYKSTGLSQQFKLEQVNSSFFVVPKDDGSILTVKVSLPFQERRLAEALVLVLEEVSRRAGVKVVLGQIPLFPNLNVSVGADSEPARDVIVKILNQIGPKDTRSYRLLYDPQLKYYMLNTQSLGATKH